jgi:hypothetical protein
VSIVKVETSSGAVYHYDTDKSRVTRTGPHSPGINYDAVPDGEWHDVAIYTEPEVGESWALVLGEGLLRVTTKVVSIEEV